MDLKHSFTVPAGIDETWAAFNDIESVAGCFPGAVVTSVEGDSFEGSCKVKLGPIALVYKGVGTFVEKDESAHRMKIEAKGKDKRGNGTAGANVTATLAEADGQTTVEVITDLNITGKPAQFGRGVMQDVSDKLLGQFVDCLQTKVGSSDDTVAAPAAGASGAGAPVAQVDPATTGPGGSGGTATADPSVPADAAAGPGAGTASPPGTIPPDSAPRKATAQQPDNDALNLGATVIPILFKTYWKPAAAVLAVIVVVVVLIKSL